MNEVGFSACNGTCKFGEGISDTVTALGNFYIADEMRDNEDGITQYAKLFSNSSNLLVL